ncbi:hypothetical protein WMF28_30265 [Sorangium sp. So ce590]
MAIAADDVEGARVAHEAIGRLLGAPAPQGEGAADMLDLAREHEWRAR